MTTLPALNISALARQHGISRTTVRRRLASGWQPPSAKAVANETSSHTRHYEIMPPSTRGHPWTAGVLILVAFGIAALAIGVNAQAGFGLGTTPAARMTLAAMAVAADVLAVILPAAAVALWSYRRPVLAALAWTLWTCVAALAVLMTIGFAERHLGDAAATREAAVTGSVSAVDRHQAAIDTAKTAVKVAMQQREAECQRRGPLCRERESDERQALAALRSALSAPLPAPSSIGVGDPQAVAAQRLASWAGFSVTHNDVVNLRLSLLVLIPNVAGLILCFGVALRRRA